MNNHFKGDEDTWTNRNIYIITEELWDEEDKMKENKVLNMADEKQKKGTRKMRRKMMSTKNKIGK